MTTPSFYSPLSEYLSLMERIEAAEGVLDPELLEALDLNQQNVQVRAGSLLDLLEVAEANNDLADAKAKQVAAFKRQNNALIERVKQVLTVGVKTFGPITTDTRRVSLRPSEAVEIVDEAEVPHAYRHPVVVPERGAPDKAKIRAAFKTGIGVAGTVLVHRTSLAVK